MLETWIAYRMQGIREPLRTTQIKPTVRPSPPRVSSLKVTVWLVSGQWLVASGLRSGVLQSPKSDGLAVRASEISHD